MHTVRLCEVNGTVLLPIPPAVLDELHVTAADAAVVLSVENGCLIIRPEAGQGAGRGTDRPHYTLEELIAQCDPSAASASEDRQWLDARPAGRELI